MTNKELIAKIKAEIERRIETYKKGYANGDDRRADALELLLSFLSTLESEKPIEGLEEEIDRVWKQCSPIDEGMGVESTYMHIEAFNIIARHFAEWQKEQMMKEAVEGTVHNFSSYKPHPTVLVDANGFNQGDKVRVIIVKE